MSVYLLARLMAWLLVVLVVLVVVMSLGHAVFSLAGGC